MSRDERPHNEIFAELQEQYLSNRDEKILVQMLEIIRQYEFRMVRKYCKRHHIFKTYDDMEEDAHDMAIWFISQYIKRPDFKAESMSAYGGNAFKKIMFDPKRKAREQFEKEVEETEPRPEETVIEYAYCPNLWEKTDEPGVFQGLLPFEEWIA